MPAASEKNYARSPAAVGQQFQLIVLCLNTNGSSTGRQPPTADQAIQAVISLLLACESRPQVILLQEFHWAKTKGVRALEAGLNASTGTSWRSFQQWDRDALVLIDEGRLDGTLLVGSDDHPGGPYAGRYAAAHLWVIDCPELAFDIYSYHGQHRRLTDSGKAEMSTSFIQQAR
jgi:hypothetical protein